MPSGMEENNISSLSGEPSRAAEAARIPRTSTDVQTPSAAAASKRVSGGASNSDSSERAWFSEEIITQQLGPEIPPMLQQYLEVKRANPDCVVLFQVGDFFEVFFDDAVEVSRRINLTLTSRDKGKENPVPMCGVPVAHIEGYLERIVDTGLSVAVVSQVSSSSSEDASAEASSEGGGARASGTRAPVQRRLTRIVTPGVRVLSNSEGSEGQAICAAVSVGGSAYSIAAADVRSGEIRVLHELGLAELLMELRTLSPSEVLLPARERGRVLDRRSAWVRTLERVLPRTSIKFRFGDLCETSGAGDSHVSMAQVTELSALKGFTVLPPLTKRAVRGLVSHINQTTVSASVRFDAIVERSSTHTMRIDAMTRQNLELVKNTREGSEAGTLFSVLKRTVSEAGTRLLRTWILEPLTNRAAIEARLQAVEALRDDATQRVEWQSAIRGLADLDRLATRIELRAVTPRELGALRVALQAAHTISQGRVPKARLLREVLDAIPPLDGASLKLSTVLADELPWTLNEGGVIRQGFDPELDLIRAQRSGSGEWMQEFECAERARTGIGSLKVKNNNVLGFFIEVTRANAGRIPAEYQRRQSTAQAERFTTEELKKVEREFVSASSREAARERQLYSRLVEELVGSTAIFRAVGRCLAQLDVLCGLADAAERNRWVKPRVQDQAEFIIRKGAHPVLAEILQGNFVPNDTILNATSRQVLILTGPNMGGKSTYLRQAALLAIMAQLGSFVPAEHAEVGIVDRIFARIGASDNISEGESTFMVEMREMAYILANATPQSLVVIDEVGRGTATADGVSIARAIVEWLVQTTRCRTLFATHYHELTELAQEFTQIKNISVTSLEEAGEVVFTHRIAEGPASSSYGVEVARLAGIPTPLIGRARQLLCSFETASAGDVVSRSRTGVVQAESQIPLFHVTSAPPSSIAVSLDRAQTLEPDDSTARVQAFDRLRAELEAVDIERTTPMEALKILDALRTEIGAVVLPQSTES